MDKRWTSGCLLMSRWSLRSNDDSLRNVHCVQSSKPMVTRPGSVFLVLYRPLERRHERRTESWAFFLTADMKRVVEEQRLGFVATVCPDGTPNLSPKGTTTVWDDEHLVFANIRSPGTLANLRRNANVEVNVVDPFVRKGYRFKGVASILESGPLYDQAIAFYKERGVTSAIREVVLVRVRSAKPINSPAYDLGLTEDQVRARWARYWQSAHAGRTTSPTGE